MKWLKYCSLHSVERGNFWAVAASKYALGLVQRIELAAMMLADQLYLAPAGRVPGTREW